MENPAPLTCALPERVATVGEGVKDSLPIVISYLPVAFAFGLNATRLGFTPLESLFFSCIIYAGASQFVITAMLAAGSSLWVAALTVMAMDVRHVLYGPSLRSRIRSALDKKKTALWAFGLTDEVFAAATARLVRDNRRWSENWMLGLAFTSWASWVCGTLAGAVYELPAGLFPASAVTLRHGGAGGRAGRHSVIFHSGGDPRRNCLRVSDGAASGHAQGDAG
ncbi:AzlC family protein [Klebsiella pneumoniae]|uniref:AzlC family protein n=1 Tax=Klebsiella pneumoniae TaxID=573 RepID=A0A377Y543_KLEPN|nr:AzlC family protein [Klebsiella pneumoniae]